MLSALDLAHDILSMQRRIEQLEYELECVAPYEKKYMDLLRSSTEHSQHMIGGILKIAMTPGVLDAIDANNQRA